MKKEPPDDVLSFLIFTFALFVFCVATVVFAIYNQ